LKVRMLLSNAQPFESKVVIDACALVNARVADVLLRLACEGMHEVFWSREILEETKRTQRDKLNWPPHILESYHVRLAEVFPHAVISGHEHWLEQCTNDAADRHVLACAIEARAGYIVTFNTDDFKEADLSRWGVRAMKPNDYLLMRYLRDEAGFIHQLLRVADRKQVRPQVLLEGLLRDCRSFAELMLRELAEG